MTERRPIWELRRPRKRLGETLRAFLTCPLCANNPGGWKPGEPRVVAFREETVRLECEHCGLRFSVSPRQLALAVMTKLRDAPDGSDDDFRFYVAKQIGGETVAALWWEQGLSPEQIRQQLAEYGYVDK